MAKNPTKPPVQIPGYRYHSPKIPMSAIRRYARQLGEKFQPDKIILFGSYAYGEPHAESDVDLLVVMPCYNHTTQAIRMILACKPPFPLDLIVRTPEKLRRRLAEGDSFLEEITTRGKVVYEGRDSPMGSQGGRRLQGRKPARTVPRSSE